MTEPNRQSGENEERIIEIEIERLRPFKEHPFQVKDDKEMFLLQESIEKYGILNPLIVRPVPDGYYEIISGHRRKHAAEKLGYRKVPVIIRVLSKDDSILSKDFEIQEFVARHYYHLKFSPSVDVKVKQDAVNPKRRQREARKQSQVIGIGTKSQQALQLQREENKLERKVISREMKEAEKQKQFELKQQKRKEKHRGR